MPFTVASECQVPFTVAPECKVPFTVAPECQVLFTIAPECQVPFIVALVYDSVKSTWLSGPKGSSIMTWKKGKIY